MQYNLLQFPFFALMIAIVIIFMSLFYNKIYSLLYLVSIIAGFTSIILNPILKDEKELIKHHQDSVWIEGEVLEIKEYTYKNYYIIKPSKVIIKGDEKSLKNKIQLKVDKDAQLPKYGDLIKLSGEIEKLTGPRNPGSFNEKKYLLTHKVVSKVNVKSLEINDMGKQLPIAKRVSIYYGNMFDRLLPMEEAQIMKAMLIGDKTLLSKEIQSLYKDVGIAHVLAISGLHISVIGVVLYWIFKQLKLSKILQGSFVILILWFYAGITGFSISITRSVIMTSILLLGDLLEEKIDPLTSLSFAALALLLYNPLYLWDVGFQLSFIAVISLILLSRYFDRIFYIPKKIRKYISPLMAVTVGTAPVIAYYYYEIATLGFIGNLFLVPLISLVVMVGFLTMLIFPLQSSLAKWVIGSSYYLLRFIENTSKIVLKIPFSTLIIGQPSQFELLLYVLFWVMIIWYLSLSLDKRQFLKKYIIMISIFVGVLIIVKNKIPKDLEVVFLDVGQGDSAVIILPDGKTFVIDGGDIGKGKEISQFLKYKGIRKIEAAVLTHAHADHMIGLGELVMTYPVGRVLLTEFPGEKGMFKGLPLYKIGAGDIVQYKDIIIECIYPFKTPPFGSGNDASAVFVLKHKEVSYYFTGDVEADAEKKLVNFLKPNKIGILKVPHHGSKTSSSQELIDSIRPDMGVISCAEKNFYQHPHGEVILRYNENNIPLFMTRDLGAIITKSSGNKVRVYTMEDIRGYGSY